MSLDVALQSVAFYVLSCSTCAKISHRRKAKIQAKRERKEKLELETEQPGLYRHPSPFSTNPYWHEEIAMGPGPPKQKGDKSGSKNGSQRALNTAGQGSSYAGSSGMSTDPGSSPTAVTDESRPSGEGWNLKRYQREDEALWGLDFHGPGQRIKEAIARAGSSAGRLLEGRLSKAGQSEKEEESSGTYFVARNPPVNDLHPPVVSTQPTSRDETKWMLQPPPPAKVMEGKERVVRSRAGSNGSSRKGTDSTPLSRQVTGRLVDMKIQRGESPYDEVQPRANSRPRTGRSTRTQDQLQDRERSSSVESTTSTLSTEDRVKKRIRKPPLLHIPPNATRDIPELGPIHSNSSTSRTMTETQERQDPSRPALETILSSRNVVPQASMVHGSDGPSQKHTRDPSKPAKPKPLSPFQVLSPSANSMPASIPSADPEEIPVVESLFPGVPAYKFPGPVSAENEENNNPVPLEA